MRPTASERSGESQLLEPRGVRKDVDRDCAIAEGRFAELSFAGFYTPLPERSVELKCRALHFGVGPAGRYHVVRAKVLAVPAQERYSNLPTSEVPVSS